MTDFKAIADELENTLVNMHGLRHRLASRSRTEFFMPGSLAPELLRRSQEQLEEATAPMRDAVDALRRAAIRVQGE